MRAVAGKALTKREAAAPIKVALGKKVRVRRKRLQLSQEELAHRAGVHATYLSAIERGADCRNSSILAAMEAGLPILTTENPRYGTDRELRAGGQCRFFDARDAVSLADTVEAVLADGPALERMRAASLRAASRNTWDEHVRVLEMAYRGDLPSKYAPETRGGE